MYISLYFFGLNNTMHKSDLNRLVIVVHLSN